MALTNEHCPVCKSTSSRLLYDLRQSSVHPNGLLGVVKQCRECKLLFKTFSQSVSDVYDESYAENFVNFEDYSGESATKLFSNILKPSYQRLSQVSTPPSLLDIGSGIGVTLDTAARMGFATTGVELCKPLAKIAGQKGHKIFQCDVADIQVNAQFDAVSMMDIIEHLVDPVSVLQSLKAQLRPGGELIVYTPDHSSLIVSVAHWMYRMGLTSPIENIFACSHTCFFTEKTLRHCIESAGFEILDAAHLPYDTSRPGQPVSSASKFFLNTIETTGKALGYNGFRVIIYARKPE
jgi:2-polyprenyl-3-methyl-5-hydroxy-6-metoxy-1,4-benzoquinol methylase